MRSTRWFGVAFTAAMLMVSASHAATAPTLTRAKLANGLNVIVMPSQRLPLVDMRLVARAGSVQDP